MTIKLSDSEVKLCELISKLRYAAARSAGVKDQRIDDSGEFLDLNGFGAEPAFCKRYNLYPDFTVGARKGGFDVRTHKGATVDVKCTKYKTGHLVATAYKELGQSDIYVLITGVIPEYEIVGYATEAELLNDKNLKDLGHGKGFALSQEQLHKFA